MGMWCTEHEGCVLIVRRARFVDVCMCVCVSVCIYVCTVCACMCM